MWSSRRSVDLPDDLADTTDAGPVTQRLVGIGVAAAVGAYGVYCIWTGRAIFPASRYQTFHEFTGSTATAIGALYLSIAAFVHLHFYWTPSPRFWAYAQLGKLLACAGIIASVFAFLVCGLLS